MFLGDHFSNLLRIKCTEFCLYSFIFDISIVQCLGVYYFTGHSVEVVDSITAYF